MSNEKDSEKSDNKVPIWLEVMKVSPQFLWFVLAMIALALLYKPAMALIQKSSDLIEKSDISKVAIWTVQIEFAQKQIAGSNSPGAPKTPEEFKPFEDRVKRSASKIAGAALLWVDDRHPTQNLSERRALSALGISIDMVTNTDQAMTLLSTANYDVVISDMDRPGQQDNSVQCFQTPELKGAGCGLLKAMHSRYSERMPPTIIYLGRYQPAWGTPPFALGVTTRVDHLLQLVLDALERRQVKLGAKPATLLG